MDKTVIELFAGVGGFRVGFNNIKKIKAHGMAQEKKDWDFVWANQWEPKVRIQHAFACYVRRFGNEHASNEDIEKVNKRTIPDHNLLVGGFPCQDYSVAHGIVGEKDIYGEKGKLWWSIYEILKAKHPKFMLLENVDRLLKAPTKQRGRSFGIILRCLNDLGYGVQWMVINASEYGHPQRRKRTFIFAFHKSTKYYKKVSAAIKSGANFPEQNQESIFAKAFPYTIGDKATILNRPLGKEHGFEKLSDLSDSYATDFRKIGYCLNYQPVSSDYEPDYGKKPRTLGSILQKENIPNHCYKIRNLDEIKYLKGAKKEKRKSSTGYEYFYSEGPLSFPDKLDCPARTLLTSEGKPYRTSHFVTDPITGKIRILTPIECERLDEFPDNWTEGMPNGWRYFICGNALVTGLVYSMAKEIGLIFDQEN